MSKERLKILKMMLRLETENPQGFYEVYGFISGYHQALISHGILKSKSDSDNMLNFKGHKDILQNDSNE